MNNSDHFSALGSYLGSKHIDKEGNLHFRARIIYKWTDKMQQDIADVHIAKGEGGAGNITISNAPSLHDDMFILNFSADKQSFKLEADNTILIITGKDHKLHGSYSVEIIPER